MNIPDQLIDRLYAGKPHLELSIGILKDGKIETVHMNPNREETPDDVIYPAGSIGKVFTASLLAKSMQEGKISLEDPLNRFIDGLPEQYYPSMQRLATHHSGYGGVPYTFFQSLIKFAHMNEPDGIMHVNPFRGTLGEAEMRNILATKKLKDKEYKFEYSNFAFGVLGYIAGKLDGSDFYTAMGKYFSSLGLANTSLANSDMTGYDKKGNPCKPWQWEKTDIIAPAGAMLSTMEDLLKFAQINMEQSAPYLELCHRIYASGDKTFDQGLGWRIKKNSSVLYHVGNAGAFTCMLAFDKETENAVAVGMNYAMVSDVEEIVFEMLEKC